MLHPLAFGDERGNRADQSNTRPGSRQLRQRVDQVPAIPYFCSPSSHETSAERSQICSMTFRARSSDMAAMWTKNCGSPSPLPEHRSLTSQLSNVHRFQNGLDGGNEIAVEGHVAVSHARRAERKAGVAVAVEQD